MIDWTQNPVSPLDPEMLTALDYFPLFAAWAGEDDLWAETFWDSSWSKYWENGPGMVAGLTSPVLDGKFRHLISHPETHEKIKVMKLPEYWRENGWPQGCEPIGDDDIKCFE